MGKEDNFSKAECLDDTCSVACQRLGGSLTGLERRNAIASAKFAARPYHRYEQRASQGQGQRVSNAVTAHDQTVHCRAHMTKHARSAARRGGAGCQFTA
jgi:hypothetical protein